MKATISLKQLRTDPREYVRLINSGYEVEITEHRQPLTTAVRSPRAAKPQQGNAQAVLEAIKKLPKVKTPFPDEDTVALMKRTRTEYLERKFGYKQ